MNTQERETYDLTNPQKSIWLTEQFYKGTPVNNVCGTVVIFEKMHFEKFKIAVNTFIKNSDAFRIRISIDKNGEPKQYISDYYELDFPIIDLTFDDELKVLEHSIVNRVFDIIDSPLFNFTLFRFPNGHGGVIMNAHHLIADAATGSLVASELVNVYSSLLKGEPVIDSAYSYLDYIHSEKDYLASNKFEKDKEYWDTCFKKTPDIVSLSTKNTDSSICHDCASQRDSFIIKKDFLDEITAFCKKYNFSIFNFFIAIYSLYIGKVRNLKNFVIGTPILNRCNYTEKHTPGMFISTVPFHLDFEETNLFKDFIQNIALQTLGMLRHQKYPYQEILQTIRKGDSSIPNLYNILISYQISKADKQTSQIPYLVTWTHSDCTSDELDIHLYDLDNSGDLNIVYDYQIAKYDSDDIKDMHQRILWIMKQVLRNETVAINKLSLVTPAEENFIVKKYNNSAEPSIHSTVIDLFEKCVAENANTLAISDGKKSLSYQELDILSNQLCDDLLERGIKKQDKVCLFFNNSIDLLASIIAALKLGVCYIPIDVSYPVHRIEYIVQNSGAIAILTNNIHIAKLSFLSNMAISIDLEEVAKRSTLAPHNDSSLDLLAYIIYTSGSTGNPKGVKIKHESLANYILWAKDTYVKNEVTHFPLYSSISFDLTVTSVFTPLISGNSIYIYENENPELLLREMIQDKKVQIIKLTPAHLNLLLDCPLKDSVVSKLIVGGDILTNEICKNVTDAFDGKISIFNEYGPTEATVGCMVYVYQQGDESSYASVPIGIPANHTNLYVVNDDLNLVPFGEVGHLYISGKCLSPGYLNLPEITNERFLSSPFKENEKIYKTGDLVKLYRNGIMEYIGRSDFQVKINGYRIEIGEIQSKILSYPNIKDCFVTTFDSTFGKSLCVYYTYSKPINLSFLKDYLLKTLPHYMVPKSFIALDKIPLTTNGKVDKSSLPKPNKTGKGSYIKPSNSIETLLMNTFCKLLSIERMSVTDNFFDYYVDSLIIIKAQTILYSNGIDINTQCFYEYPSIRSLANHIKKTATEEETFSSSSLVLPTSVSSIAKKVNPIASPNHVLLFGVTGFIGIHILKNLLEQTKATVYCLIRDKNGIDSESRFYHKFKFYFSNDVYELYKDRIVLVKGDLLKPYFDLSKSNYYDLRNRIDMVISSAAIVKHYGNYRDFYATNVEGTSRIVDFCLEKDIPFHYLSTMSVSGYGLVAAPKTTFTEDNFYVGQKYEENVYIKSKFEAENLILQSCINHGLKASIYRVGNITNRYEDGIFQENATSNAFLNRFSSLINLGVYPKLIENLGFELTPVDYCAKFIVALLPIFPNTINIYHLYNPNELVLSDFLTILNDHGIILKPTSLKDFENIVLTSEGNYFGITNYISSLKDANLNNITLSNASTNAILKSLNLEWPKIDVTYINKLLSYLTSHHFIDKNMS